MDASPEVRALQETGRRMFLTQDSSEIIRLLSEAVVAYTHARAVSVFLFSPTTGTLQGGDPALHPEPAVLEYIFSESLPPTIPHGEGHVITVFPLKVAQRRVGVLVLDVTGVAEEVAALNLEPVILLAGEAATAMVRPAIARRMRP